MGRWAEFSPLWTGGHLWVGEEDGSFPRFIAALVSSSVCQAGHQAGHRSFLCLRSSWRLYLPLSESVSVKH